jgi:radical SAM superfamily enzyme YgiQ (UPF0313 family)
VEIYDPEFRFSEKPSALFVRPRLYVKQLPFVSTQPPLNLAILAAVALHAGAKVDILDLDVETEKSFEEKIRQDRPDTIAFTAMTPQVPEAYRLAKKAKEIHPSATVVIGGPHASALPERTLRECAEIDRVVIGEGELPLLGGLESGWDEKTPGTACRNLSGEPVVNERPAPIENLDLLPPPARHILPMKKYRGQSYRGFSRDVLKLQEIVTARGCPASCLFCACGVVHGKGVRKKPVESVQEEINELVSTYGARHFVVLDDTFNADRDRSAAIAEVFRKRGLTFSVTMRARKTDYELARQLAKCGCTGAAIGVESGSGRIRKLIGKGASGEDIITAFDALHRVGIKNIEADFMLGSHPDETWEDFAETEKLIRRIRPDILFLSIAVPLPGTRLREIMLKEKLLSDNVPWDRYLFYGEPPPWRTKHFTGEELVRHQRRILRKYLFSGRSIAGRLRKIASVRELRYYISAGIAFLRG